MSSLVRDLNYDFFTSLPPKFKYAVLPEEPDMFPKMAERNVYHLVTERDKKFATFLRSFIYQECQPSLKVVGLVGSVGAGKTHLMCAAANLVRCYDFRTFFAWRSLSIDLLISLGMHPPEFSQILLDQCPLFIDDLKFTDKTGMGIEIFSSMIMELYDNPEHPGIIFTQNWEEGVGDIKDHWYRMVPPHIADRLVSMTQFLKMTGPSRREEI